MEKTLEQQGWDLANGAETAEDLRDAEAWVKANIKDNDLYDDLMRAISFKVRNLYTKERQANYKAAHQKAVTKNLKKNYFRYTVNLNKNTDADLIALLEGSDNKLKLVKDALRAYITQSKQTDTDAPGKWLLTGNDYKPYRCSSCQMAVHDDQRANICPNCGKKMMSGYYSEDGTLLSNGGAENV